ncbi:MAG: UvrD-helicase domain-containing protein, partial [Gammaproteobacteria bacterium]|nr:UvrD-helicase domain-containing protein [Gammaproteobacteria bacterium]
MNSAARAIPADADVRHRALEPECSFIVQAPAGSGKTELLVRRLLRLLARVDEPEEIVALTFTRKAAAEMRARVIDALNAVVADTNDRTVVEQADDELRSLARAVLRRDAERDWSLSIYPARLRIMTLDAWCAALVQRMPWSSGFGSPPQVRTDAEPMYREAARATLRLLESDTKVWSQAVEALLERFDNDLPRLETLLVEMLAHRDQWLRHIVGSDVEPVTQRAQFQADWEWVVERELQKVRATVPAAHVDALNNSAAYALRTAAAESGSVADAAGLPGAEAGSLPAWRVLASMLLTKQGAWRKTTGGVPGFAATTAPAEQRHQLKQLLQALPECPAFAASLRAVTLLPDPDIDTGGWQAYRALYELLPLAVAQLQLLFQASGNVDFTEIAQRAAFALGSADAPTDLALALDYRLQHLLVDEFQDTSYTQLDLLHKLTAGWEPGDGRTLFLVGDPMQSIYRFREAEVGIFLQTMCGRFGDLALESLTLSANFRSQSGLIDWVNTTFVAALPSHPDSELGAVPFMASTAMHAAQPNAVTVNPQLGDDPQQEAEWVSGVVNAERARNPGQTIAILVRSRTHLCAIMPCLRAAGLRFYGVELESLANQPAIQDLVALTRALLHPSDSVAWMTVLRAPWCGLML